MTNPYEYLAALRLQRDARKAVQHVQAFNEPCHVYTVVLDREAGTATWYESAKAAAKATGLTPQQMRVARLSSKGRFEVHTKRSRVIVTDIETGEVRSRHRSITCFARSYGVTPSRVAHWFNGKSPQPCDATRLRTGVEHLRNARVTLEDAWEQRGEEL